MALPNHVATVALQVYIVRARVLASSPGIPCYFDLWFAFATLLLLCIILLSVQTKEEVG